MESKAGGSSPGTQQALEQQHQPPGAVINAEFVSRTCYTGVPFCLPLHGTGRMEHWDAPGVRQCQFWGVFPLNCAQW